MEKVVTHHPFRTIELEYDREKPQPDWEKETLDNYFHMHDEVWRLKTIREEYEPQLDRAIAWINELRTELYPIEQEIDLLELATGLRDDNPMPGFEGSISLQLDNFRKATKKHNEDLIALHTLITQCIGEHNVFLKDYETFDEWFESFASGPLHQLYMRYEDISVHTVSLDRDHQSFLETWSPVIQAERDYFERATDAFEAYTELAEASEKLYRRAEKVDDSLDDFIKKNKNGGDGQWRKFP
ncbi:hypothetical protein [Parapedobacter tibetensis]|uniref:hypothetical protein n=1 Tax=Parapedobacter tibetensis TaxID=2972951 RepID=UPI00214DC2C5|nr:hypothetical protein [Parapedobacter tibetensis]